MELNRQPTIEAKTRAKHVTGKIGAALLACCFAAPLTSFASYAPAAGHSEARTPALRYAADADDYYRANPRYQGGEDANWREQHERTELNEQNERFDARQNRRDEHFNNRMNRARARHARREMREQEHRDRD